MKNASNTPSNTHFLIHWLKFTWVPPNYVVSYKFGGSHVSINQSKRVCVRRCVASISHIKYIMHLLNLKSRFLLINVTE